MKFWHYFSKDEDKRALFIFNLIAPFYHWIDGSTATHYQKMASLLTTCISVTNQTVLDVGCGTGAWISALSRHHLKKAVGTDISVNMLAVAKKNYPELTFVQMHGENLSAFPDNAFDIVTAAFVLHGMKSKKRARLLAEMKRVARQYVVIHDFYKGISPSVWLLETLERSDYAYFKKHFHQEMKNTFSETDLCTGPKGNALYIGKVTTI
jgi:ubiquinone/menaquinone biosynthesis C-methylase UbiE